MTIYQEEMQRKAFRYGCTTEYDAEDQLLTIAHNGIYLTGITPEGFMHYTSKDLSNPTAREVFMHLLDDAEVVREYVGLYESSKQMKPKAVRNYRKFAEYGDVVFAGMKDGDIIESGTHKELLSKGGFYADLYNSQFDEVS